MEIADGGFKVHEVAANFLEKKDGPGMFKARLMDCVYHVTTKWNLVNLNPEKMS